MPTPTTDAQLQVMLEEWRKICAKMTPEEKEEMHRKQRESWVRAEMNWPKPKFTWVNGVKVYDSYEDYCND